MDNDCSKGFLLSVDTGRTRTSLHPCTKLRPLAFHRVALVRLPTAAAAGPSGGSSIATSSSDAGPVEAARNDVAVDAHTAWSKQQPAAGRQPASFDAAAAHADPTSGTDARTAADVAAAGSTGGGLTSQQADSIASTDRTAECTEDAAAADASATNATSDNAAITATSTEPASGSTRTRAAAAGSSGGCPCPPLETEADAAAAQAYGRDYFAICLSVKVRRSAA
jgi:hypothetical protein